MPETDERFAEIVKFRTEYGIRGLDLLVGVFIKRAPEFKKDKELAGEISVAMRQLMHALSKIPTIDEYNL